MSDHRFGFDAINLARAVIAAGLVITMHRAARDSPTTTALPPSDPHVAAM